MKQDSRPRIILLMNGIGLSMTESKIRIGVDVDSHVLLPLPENQDCQIGLHNAGETSVWSMHVDGVQGAWVNDRFFTQGHDEIPLRNGDSIKVGGLQFRLSLPVVTEDVPAAAVPTSRGDQDVWHDTGIAGDQIPTQEQNATESLRIVPDLRRQHHFLTWRVATHIAAVLACISLSTVIMSRILVRDRPGASARTVVADTTREAAFPTWRWLDTKPVPLICWQGLPQELQQEQDSMAAHFHAARYAEAERTYRERIFPHLYAEFKGRENLGRYNGLACRFLLLLQKASNDPAAASLLRQELAAVELQVAAYVLDKEHQERFRQLLRHLAGQLSGHGENK